VLKNIDPLLGPELLWVLRAMGHGDEIAIVDANYPAEEHAKRLIRMDGHDAPRLVDAILSVMPVDDLVAEAVFRPTAFGDPKRMEPVFGDFTAAVMKHEPERQIVPLTGVDFYNRVKVAFAIVASGERRLYGNLIIRKGVIRP
jgi:L-fucose mutarotase